MCSLPPEWVPVAFNEFAWCKLVSGSLIIRLCQAYDAPFLWKSAHQEPAALALCFRRTVTGRELRRMFVEGCWCYCNCKGTEKFDVIIVEFKRNDVGKKRKAWKRCLPGRHVSMKASEMSETGKFDVIIKSFMGKTHRKEAKSMMSMSGHEGLWAWIHRKWTKQVNSMSLSNDSW